MPFRREFPFIPQAPGLYILRGSRQIGKSSWLKTILSYCVKKDQSCFDLSCEGIEDHRELTLVLQSVERRSVILLDEVNFVRGWDRAIKHFIDSGYQGILIVTGSHSYDLKKGADHMPGRFGGGGEFYLLPMSFEEFTAARAQAGWQKKNRVEELVDCFKVGGLSSRRGRKCRLRCYSNKIYENHLALVSRRCPEVREK